MDTSRLLLLILVVMSTSECSEPQCDDFDKESFNLLEGEAFYFVPHALSSDSLSNEEITWYKNNSEATEYISSNETERIHYHGGALFILNLLTEDSGLYIAKHIESSGKCSNYYVNVEVFKTSHQGNNTLLYGQIKNSDVSKKVPCPVPVKDTCDKFGGNFTWYKSCSGRPCVRVRIEKATKEHEGIYTCVCTWTYNHKVYNSSGSRRLQLLECEDNSKEKFNLLEGEAFYFVPYALKRKNVPNEEITWYKNSSEAEHIPPNRTERIHYHGGALLFLNLLTEDSGLYIAKHIDLSGKCINHYVKVEVFKTSQRGNSTLLYGQIKNSHLSKKVPCPVPVKNTCDRFGGNFTWYKDFSRLQGDHVSDLRIEKATKEHEGIYTCVCTWTYNHTLYNSSGSRRLQLLESSVYRMEILSPTNEEQIVEEGTGTKLNCSVYCGTNAKRECHASWHVNGEPVKQTERYNHVTKINIEEPSKKTTATAILTIDKVSAEDFQVEFECIGQGFYARKSATLTIKRGASVLSLVIRLVCVLLFCGLAALLVKCYAIDLALFFRSCSPRSSHSKDARLYDAYVIYQTQRIDKVTEDTLSRFVTQILPCVLEEKCGYRLFIHGRDDIPGEDRLELVEDCMEESKRLMVILTPGSGSGSEVTDQCPTSPQNSAIGGFDWQVGLHHALVQREMSVILIQLGDMGPKGYTYLPPGLQHLIRKSAPLKWPEGSRGAAWWNSGFWKRVRYLMPATPAKKCLNSAII